RSQHIAVIRDVGFGNRNAAAVHAAAFDDTLVGWLGPTFAGWHHVAVGVERDDWTAFTEAMANDQIGDALHAVLAQKRFRYRMALRGEAKLGEQFDALLGGRRVVARGRVRRHPNQLVQEFDLLSVMRIDPALKLVVRIHGWESLHRSRIFELLRSR